MSIETNNWDVETYMNKLEKIYHCLLQSGKISCYWWWKVLNSSLMYCKNMVFCFQNCSYLTTQWKKIVLEIEKNFWKLFKMTKTIYSNSERSVQLLKQNTFLTCSWRFLRSDTIEQLEFNWKKWLGFRNLQEKLEKTFSIWDCNPTNFFLLISKKGHSKEEYIFAKECRSLHNFQFPRDRKRFNHAFI